MKNRHAVKTHYVACNLCEAICGLEIKLENGQIKSIRGDEQDPASKGHICPKAIALQDIYNDPDRLRSPIRKTADGWRKISWKRAFDEVAAGLKSVQDKHGRNAVAVYLGNPTVHNLEALLFGPEFFRTLRTGNRYSATSVDQLPEQLVSLLMFGHGLLIPLPDLDRTAFHLIFGANPVVSNGSMMTAPGVAKRLKAIRQRGGQLVVVDPRRTETAEIADQHLFIRPGSDVFMLLAMLQVVFNEKLQTLGSVAGYTSGLEIIETLVQDYPPERVARITGIEAETLKTLARDFCAAQSASCYGRIGASAQQFGSLTQWLITVLNIVSGNLDVAGGTMFSKPAFEVVSARKAGKKGFADHHSRVRNLPDFNGEFPVATLAEEIITPGEGQVRALVTSAGNPVLSTPNSRQLDTALGELEFMVSIDIYLNETTRHANIILPPLTGLERPQYDVVFQALAIRNAAKYSPPVFKAAREQRSDLQIFTELGWRMQKGNLFQKAGAWVRKKALQRLGSEWVIGRKLRQGPYYKSHGLDLRKLRNNPHGVDLGPLQPCLPERLFTADKTIQLAPQEFVDEMKHLADFFAADEMVLKPPEFDLQLIGRRDPRTNNSWLHNSRRLVKGKNRCVALIHPQDAESRGLIDGDVARVSSRVGSVSIPIAISDEMKAGVISIPHGWGHDVDGINLGVAQQHAGVNTNQLTDHQFLDSLSGNAALNGIPVSLTKDVGQGPG
ncbi:MAG TPA: molybdopterin oxidoreductase family protein [Xanthomonadales bacterium]